MLGSKEIDPGSSDVKQPRFGGDGFPSSAGFPDGLSNDFVGDVFTF